MSKNLERNLDDEEVCVTRNFVKILWAIYSTAILALGSWALYDNIKREYNGSLSKFYMVQMEKLEKAPARMWNTF